MADALLFEVDGETPINDEPFAMLEDEDAPPRQVFGVTLLVRDSTHPQPNGVLRGRDLTPDDRGKQVVVVAEDWAATQGVDVGSTLKLQMEGALQTFEVVGISPTSGRVAFGKLFIPPGLTSGSGFQFNILQVAPEYLNEVLLRLSENPLVFAVDITFIDGLLKRLIDQFAAIPTVVGLLSLLAAAVAMANTVSLQTLERRRQIGVLKAVGLKGRRVLLVMLLENTLIGLLGGLIGIGVSALLVAIMTSFGAGDAIAIPRDAAPVAIALVLASVLIAWTATFLSARVVIRERVANVLRYE
jgi:ABC-type antimicrobial peptide transport system permease subunit